MDTKTTEAGAAGGGQVDAGVKPFANGGLISGGPTENAKRFIFNPSHNVFVHPGGAGWLRKMQKYFAMVEEIKAMRPDVEEWQILQYARQNAATTTDTFLDGLCYCKGLAAAGKPLPWETV